ncbi:nitroreductase family protein [Microbacterium sp. LRZ72]|uniref:nitroreductase family protein n=1 Tax=Microbacterium sp. LRZ72 TaxID=2942481 RepID=UPI0029AAC56F|nr:nitroreductase family protein [Microbacterium sp. LRZ72]MDX2376564.1 nitroreductase family protein [Microbacterium sp. LRZ72]
MTATAYRRTAPTDVPILDVLAERWSTRVFDSEAAIDEQALASALEAARWSPSASNTQPWRFIVARRGSDAFEAVHRALRGFNKEWTGAASALIVSVAETVDDQGRPRNSAVYDVGQAAAHFTVQAHAEGLHTHQMGGFDAAIISEAFTLDARFVPLTVMAVGTLGDIDAVSDELRDRELTPRARRPLVDSLLVDA